MRILTKLSISTSSSCVSCVIIIAEQKVSVYSSLQIDFYHLRPHLKHSTKYFMYSFFQSTADNWNALNTSTTESKSRYRFQRRSEFVDLSYKMVILSLSYLQSIHSSAYVMFETSGSLNDSTNLLSSSVLFHTTVVRCVSDENVVIPLLSYLFPSFFTTF